MLIIIFVLKYSSLLGELKSYKGADSCILGKSHCVSESDKSAGWKRGCELAKGIACSRPICEGEGVCEERKRSARIRCNNELHPTL